ncbi:MAG: tetratricopeptide repeat protein [Wolbachia endosymbiont of Fragariocoptes setiger]|nr:tetratricopeptide repeat protein [Wolbachia endosymbiont of Fragariocoptes setiger]
MGNAYENIGEYNKQKELLKKALEIEKKHYGNKHIKVATTMINLGNIYGMLGKYNKQKELLEKALGIEKNIMEINTLKLP